MKQEKTIKPISRWVMLPVLIAFLIAVIAVATALQQPLFYIGIVLFLLALPGFFYPQSESKHCSHSFWRIPRNSEGEWFFLGKSVYEACENFSENA